MRRRLIYLTCFFIVFLSSAAVASDICVQYKRSDGTWGDSYKIPFTILKGSDLNRKLNAYNFTSYSKYVIGEWPNGGYSLFEVPSYINEPPIYYIDVKDQNNREYQIKKSPSYGSCY